MIETERQPQPVTVSMPNKDECVLTAAVTLQDRDDDGVPVIMTCRFYGWQTRQLRMAVERSWELPVLLSAQGDFGPVERGWCAFTEVLATWNGPMLTLTAMGAINACHPDSVTAGVQWLDLFELGVDEANALADLLLPAVED